ncbi:fibronectin type III domain-containing protein [Terribacillus sp. 7520-G]|uniref:fibronectin type III domain-containing protein n=1 Tax=Terribacillus sp. 7520-G TaxID=2025389 RepID=UPI000BA7A325|nr:fibronectin type III domain-containing protein [Terribacillus sp. 7520-G]PAD39812.1 hypothetical protein CHH53_04010 [Terribacillus sp. 7520-G]
MNLLPPNPPQSPTGLTATSKSDTSVSLSWSAVQYDGGIQNYEIYRDGVSQGTRVGTSYSSSNLSPETTYVYQVKAIANDGQVSELSKPLSVTTDATA